MNLIIDIGNTRTKLGIFQEGELLQKVIWNDWALADLKKFVQDYPSIQRVAVTTVTSIWADVEKFLHEHFFYIKLHHETPLPIRNRYQTPETLGKDRLAAIVGAKALFPKQNCLVIDAGTCITYDILLADGDYIGGNIAPGIEMRLKAMHEFTARLPKVEQNSLGGMLLGNTTETALQLGGQLGASLEVEGFISLYSQRLGDLSVILTGGDATFFANNLKTTIFVNPNLVLVGLNKILEHNVLISA